MLAVYVDDILIARNLSEFEKVKRTIKDKFNIKDIGVVNFVIDIKNLKNNKDRYILHQKKKIYK